MGSDDAEMTIRLLRLLTLTAALMALVLPAAGVAAPRAKPVDRGVVQSVSPSEIVLTALDGSVLTFPVTPKTKVRVNRARASLDDVRPGFVASVTRDRKAQAVRIDAFGKVATVTDRGVVTALTRNAITMRTADGGTLTIPLDRKTRFRFRGRAARPALARPGALVAVIHATDAPALGVNVLKRAGA
jgi:hypothetical protein